ncbi:MAG: hypothetical protein ABIH28_02575 [archaeon]
MLNSPKRAIWEALILAGLVFFLGFSFGFLFESGRTDKMNDYYFNSEFILMDSIVLNSLVDEGIFDCASLYATYSSFADRVYQEALLLEKYESSEQITEEMKIVHRRYDLLRTFLWTSTLKTSKKCQNSSNTLVYLYEYNTENLAKKATQNVWSKVLFDLKQEEENKFILIPIAADLNITSLDVLVKNFNISSYPVVIINGEKVITELISSAELKNYLK